MDKNTPKCLKLCTSSSLFIQNDVGAVVVVICHDFRLCYADLHAIKTGPYSKSVGKVLQFVVAIFFCKAEVADGPFSNGDGGGMVMECFLHYFFQKKVEH